MASTETDTFCSLNVLLSGVKKKKSVITYIEFLYVSVFLRQ